MKTAPRTLAAPARAARPLLLSLALLLALSFPAAASPARVPPVLADGFSARQLYKPVEWALGSQRRMLQVATIGMCLALWIMMKK